MGLIITLISLLFFAAKAWLDWVQRPISALINGLERGPLFCVMMKDRLLEVIG